jgi:nitrogenase molybdenum-iron protein alpha/beta subunit
MAPPSAEPEGRNEQKEDLSQRAIQTYMIGVFLAVNAIRDAYLLVEGPDCIHMKTQFVQGNHDWLSTLTSVSGYHRVANTALHPVHMTASREEELRRFLTRIAERPSIPGVLLTSMPMAFITGSDYDRLCREVSEATGKSLVHVKGKSLSGDWLDGYEESLLSLARQLDLSGGNVHPNKVAIIGNLFDRNEADHRGNVRELRRTLHALGLEISSIWLEGGDFAELASVRDAGTILSFPYGRRAARWVARRTGARLVTCELPFGLTASERWVHQLGEAFGREKDAADFIDHELSEVVPSLEWVVPFFFQNRRWGYVGDPHLANGLWEIAETLGARLVFVAITNTPHHERELSRDLAQRATVLVYPRQQTLNKFLHERIGADVVNLVVTHSDALPGAPVATVELGFPSMYTHCLYDRPFLGFRGFLAVVDSMVNAIRRQEIAEQAARWRRGPSSGG